MAQMRQHAWQALLYLPSKRTHEGDPVSASLTVEQLSIQDAEEAKHLYDVVVEANSGTQYDVLWRRDLHPSDKNIEDALRAGHLYGAWLDGHLVGAGIFNSDFAQGYEDVPWTHVAELDATRCLHLFCTHPGYQGRGIATCFLERALALLKQQGVRVVRLDVFEHNLPAKRLYEKVGFTLAANTYLTYEDQAVSHILFSMYEIAL